MAPRRSTRVRKDQTHCPLVSALPASPPSSGGDGGGMGESVNADPSSSAGPLYSDDEHHRETELPGSTPRVQMVRPSVASYSISAAVKGVINSCL